MNVGDINVEVSRTGKSIEYSELVKNLNKFLMSLSANNIEDQIIECTKENSPDLYEYVQSISIDLNHNKLTCNFSKNFTENSNIIYHMYQPFERPSEIETFENDGDEEVPASNHWILPSKEFIGLWESLIYEDSLKENIMKFIETSILFGTHNVNQHIISCNRIVLLHGPPGTGKTSLCKAIAQKLSIRLISMYKYTHLIEINSHSLFSKWFSESGKLVMKLFSKIREMVLMPKSLVCVLIDEIESLAYARNAISGNEPRDALRVVNAVLTQLDQIKNFPNVLILSTSNLTSSIDIAFIDRSDIKQFIGYPSVKAVYDIYTSAIKELKRVNIINTTEEIIPFNRLETHKNSQICLKLLNIAERSIGLSGRTLRKLPFLAHALFCHKNLSINLDNFIDALLLALERERFDQSKIREEHSSK